MSDQQQLYAGAVSLLGNTFKDNVKKSIEVRRQEVELHKQTTSIIAKLNEQLAKLEESFEELKDEIKVEMEVLRSDVAQFSKKQDLEDLMSDINMLLEDQSSQGSTPRGARLTQMEQAIADINSKLRELSKDQVTKPNMRILKSSNKISN